MDSRGEFDSGNLLVQTDDNYYEPGHTVTGKIYLRVHRNVELSYILLEIKGKERGTWRNKEYKQVLHKDG